MNVPLLVQRDKICGFWRLLLNSQPHVLNRLFVNRQVYDQKRKRVESEDRADTNTTRTYHVRFRFVDAIRSENLKMRRLSIARRFECSFDGAAILAGAFWRATFLSRNGRRQYYCHPSFCMNFMATPATDLGNGRLSIKRPVLSPGS